MLKQSRGILLAVLVAFWPVTASAAVLSSPNFRLDPNVTGTFGGQTGSASYKLQGVGGETAIGSGGSQSYKLTSGYVSQLEQSIQLNVQPNGLAAYYPLDTNIGTAIYDVSANNSQGAGINTPAWVAGKIGRALSFNGTSQYTQTPDAASLDDAGSITIEAWVNPTDFTGTNTIVSKSTNAYELRIEATTGKLVYETFDTAAKTLTSSSALTSGAMSHVAVVKTGGTATLYINGVASGSLSGIGTVADVTNPLRIGANVTPANFFKGTIDEVKIFNRALSESEIKNEYTSQNAGIASAQTIPENIAGVSQSRLTDIVVRTDAPDYTLGIHQDKNLTHTDNTTTIAAIAGTIGTPASWAEGTTKGLGFTVSSVTGTGNTIDAKWNAGANYAAIPGTATVFHTRNGFTGGGAERNTIQFRLDTDASQKSGSYSNTVTVTATLIP